jgi:hypothetical protein
MALIRPLLGEVDCPDSAAAGGGRADLRTVESADGCEDDPTTAAGRREHRRRPAHRPTLNEHNELRRPDQRLDRRRTAGSCRPDNAAARRRTPSHTWRGCAPTYAPTTSSTPASTLPPPQRVSAANAAADADRRVGKDIQRSEGKSVCLRFDGTATSYRSVYYARPPHRSGMWTTGDGFYASFGSCAGASSSRELNCCRESHK